MTAAIPDGIAESVQCLVGVRDWFSSRRSITNNAIHGDAKRGLSFLLPRIACL